MSVKTRFIVIGVPAVLCLAACQSLQSDRQALRIVPAEQVRHSVSQPDALYAVGRYHQGQVRYDKAIAAYMQLLADYPDHAEAHNALGIIFASQGRADAAIDEFAKAVANAPESASMHNNLGYAYMLLGSVDKAVAALEVAAQLDPANQRVRDNLGMALKRGGKDNGDAPAPSSLTGVDARDPAEVKGSARANGMQLVPIAANVFALQLPPRTPVNAPSSADAPVAQSQGQTALVQADVSGPNAPGTGMRLEVSNGNGVTGLARKTAGHLEGSGYAKVRMTNELPYRLPATEIQYRPGFEPQARDLQTTLRTGIPLVASKQLRPDIQVRLVLGKDVKMVTEVVAQAPSAQSALQLAAVTP